MVRTRIAPSPTGFAHVGIAYGALFNYAFAKKNEGKFAIRLEDTDQKRHVPKAEEAIYAGLSWLGITWDEGPDKDGPFGPYKQSERLEIYQKKIKELVEKGIAFESEGAIRFKNPGDQVTWIDLIRGEITFPGEEVTDFVLVKSDGFPTFNFANVVDDHEMRITHIIRGEEHISNTPRHIALYKAFGWEIPNFAHFPTLRAPDRKKLSKRRDPVDLRIYREEGYLPEALVNFLCLLGWSHPEGKEIFSLDEFVQNFSLERVKRAGPIFDVKKLEWINGMYIRNTEDTRLIQLVKEYITADVSDDLLRQIAPLIKERMSKLSDAEELLELFWKEPILGRELFEDGTSGVYSEKSNVYIAAALRVLEEVENWNLEEINKALLKEIEEKEFKVGDFFMCMRIALSGKRVTPPINESMVILGKDVGLRRLKNAQKVLI